MTEHSHSNDDPRMCMECAPSHVTASDVAAALVKLGAHVGSAASLTDRHMIGLLGQLHQHVVQVIKHHVDPTNHDHCVSFVSATDVPWSSVIAHSVLPPALAASGVGIVVTSQAVFDPAAVNLLQFVSMACELVGEFALLRTGHENVEVDLLYRRAASLAEGLLAIVEDRSLTPNSDPPLPPPE